MRFVVSLNQRCIIIFNSMAVSQYSLSVYNKTVKITTEYSIGIALSGKYNCTSISIKMYAHIDISGILQRIFLENVPTYSPGRYIMVTSIFFDGVFFGCTYNYSHVRDYNII